MTRATKTILAGIATTGILMSANGANAQLPTRHVLTYEVALAIAQGAVESCGAKGYAESAVVVDAAGDTVVAIRGDNAAPHTMENARRKAYTAMAFRVSTTEYAKRVTDKNPTTLQQLTLPNVIAIPGGLPIMVGKEVVGGIGASGSPGVDEPCSQAGIDKVKDQLQ